VAYNTHHALLPPPLPRFFCYVVQIRSLAPLSSLTADSSSSPPLTELFVAANKVTAIEALGGFSQLTVLELGSNRIRTIEGLEVRHVAAHVAHVAECSW
jgi:protein phosphatase 1 regulatory subunit 7